MTEAAVPPPQFGLYAERYARYRLIYPPALYDLILSRLAGPRAHAVDLGAGTGQVSLDLLSRFGRVTAVEPDPAMAALISAHERLMVVAAKAEEAKFPAASVDAILCGTAFHWMDADAVCVRAKRWLRPGGIFSAFAYDHFSTPDAPAVQDVVTVEGELWQGRKHEHLARLATYADRVRETGVFDRVEPLRLDAEWRASPAALAGFWMTTSFAVAHAHSTGDEAAYAQDFAARLAAAAGGGEVRVRYVIDGVIAFA